MNYYFIAYILLSVLFGLTVGARLLQTGRMWAAVSFVVLSIFVFIFFGTRWFSDGNIVGTYTGSWPPIINTCPDYLVFFKKGNANTCIDLLGVNRSNGALLPWSGSDSPSNPPKDPHKYFPFTYSAGMGPSQLQTLCDAAQQLGLTWEGITNGESCSFPPPSQVLGPDASGQGAASACPSALSSVTSSLQAGWDSLTSDK